MTNRDKLILEAVTVCLAATETPVVTPSAERLRDEPDYRRAKRGQAERLLAELKNLGLEFAGSDKQIAGRLEAPLLKIYTRPAVLVFDPRSEDTVTATPDE